MSEIQEREKEKEKIKEKENASAILEEKKSLLNFLIREYKDEIAYLIKRINDNLYIMRLEERVSKLQEEAGLPGVETSTPDNPAQEISDLMSELDRVRFLLRETINSRKDLDI